MGVRLVSVVIISLHVLLIPIAANTIQPGNHEILHSNIIETTSQGESTWWVDHTSTNIGGSLQINTSSGAEVIAAKPLRMQSGDKIEFQAANPLRVQGTLSLNKTNLENVGSIRGNSINLRSPRNGVSVVASNAVKIRTGNQPAAEVSGGYVSFDEGTDVNAFTTTVKEDDKTVPVASAVEPFTTSKIINGFQDLGYADVNSPTSNQIQHRVEITNGSNTVINDYYEPDDQALTFSGSTPAEAATTHTLNIDRGAPVQITDNYEKDDVVPDNQGLSVFENSPVGSPDTEFVEVWIDGNDFDGSLGTPYSFVAFEDRDVEYTTEGYLTMQGLDPTTMAVNAANCGPGEALDDTLSCEPVDTFTGGSGVAVADDGTITSEAGAGLTDIGDGHEISFAGSGCSTGELVTGLGSTGVNCATT